MLSELRDRFRVVLVATRNPLNIGAAARAMSNFGFHDLALVTPFEPSFREARSAVGAAELLANAREYSSVADAIADCTLVIGTTAATNRTAQQPLYRLDEAGALIRAGLASGRVALLFGSEKRGLANQDLSHCHFLLRIPTRSEHGSMNLGQSVAVCLYELIRSGEELPVGGAATPATAADLERVTAMLMDAFGASGYIQPATEAATLEKTRRLVHRLSLQSEDAELLLGMLRQIVWKLRK